MKDDFGSPARVEWHLANWVLWMRRPELGLDYPSKSSGFVGGGYQSHIDDWEATYDNWAAETTDRIIADLTPVEQAAIHHGYLSAVYRFREPLPAILERARGKIGVGLRAWGIL